MHSRITPMLLASAALLLMTSCGQKVDSDAKRSETETAAKSEDPFVLVQRLVKDDGAYELLTLIEGVDANHQFVTNLNLVRGQRAALKKLKELTEKTEEVEQQIEDVEKKLQENANLMAKIYRYNTSSNYLFIPMNSALIKVIDDKKELIKKIDSPKEHHRLQAMRAKYVALAKKDGKNSADAKTLATKLMRDFSYDVKSNYVIEVSKGALYRKVD